MKFALRQCPKNLFFIRLCPDMRPWRDYFSLADGTRQKKKASVKCAWWIPLSVLCAGMLSALCTRGRSGVLTWCAEASGDINSPLLAFKLYCGLDYKFFPSVYFSLMITILSKTIISVQSCARSSLEPVTLDCFVMTGFFWHWFILIYVIIKAVMSANAHSFDNLCFH